MLRNPSHSSTIQTTHVNQIQNNVRKQASKFNHGHIIDSCMGIPIPTPLCQKNSPLHRRQANTELYLAKETSMDWPCSETRQTFV